MTIPARRIVFFLAAALLAFFAYRLYFLAHLQSDTYDELKCLRAGEHISRDLDWSVEASIFHPPLSYYAHGFLLRRASFADDGARLAAARTVMAVFPVLLGIFVFRYARERSGDAAALTALALYTFCPNVLAQSPLIQPDMLVTTFIFTGYYLYARSLDDAKRTAGKLAAGAALGLALLSKYTGVFLLPMTALLGLLRVYERKIPFAKFLRHYAYVALVGLFILNAGYLFRGSFTPLRDFSFESGFFSALAELPVLSRLPVPAPAPFVYGFDSQKHIAEAGHPTFLAGERSVTGWKKYFAVAYLIKTPIPFLLLLPAAFFFGFRKKLEFLIPVVCLTAPFLLLTNSNPGVRYLLPVFPFLYVYAGSLAALVFPPAPREGVKGRKQKAAAPAAGPAKHARIAAGAVLGVLMAWYAAESLRIHPHYIAYFNQFIGGPENGYKYLADSNIDWGQDRYLVEKYLKDHPGTQLNPEDPVEGKVLINVNTLQDVFRREEKHRWLKEFAPAGHIGYSWLLYDLPRDAYANLLERRPDDAYVHYLYGFVTGGRGALEKAVALDPGLDEARLKLSLLSIEQGDYGRAVSELEALLRVHPMNATALYYLSWICEQEGKKELAKKYAKRSTVTKVLNSYTVHVPTDTGHYRQVLTKDPEDAKAWNNLGFLYWADGELDRAEECFGKAYGLDPRRMDYLGNLAVVYRDKGMRNEYEAAKLEYRQRFHLIPSSRIAQIWYGTEMMTLEDTLVIPFPEGRE